MPRCDKLHSRVETGLLSHWKSRPGNCLEVPVSKVVEFGNARFHESIRFSIPLTEIDLARPVQPAPEVPKITQLYG